MNSRCWGKSRSGDFLLFGIATVVLFVCLFVCLLFGYCDLIKVSLVQLKHGGKLERQTDVCTILTNTPTAHTHAVNTSQLPLLPSLGLVPEKQPPASFRQVEKKISPSTLLLHASNHFHVTLPAFFPFFPFFDGCAACVQHCPTSYPISTDSLSSCANSSSPVLSNTNFVARSAK